MSFLFFTSLLLHYIFNIQIASRHCDSYRYVLCICDANDASTKRGMNATLVCGTCFWAKKTTTKQHITKCKAISQCSFQSLNIDKQRRWYGRGALRLLFSFVTFFLSVWIYPTFCRIFIVFWKLVHLCLNETNLVLLNIQYMESNLHALPLSF